MRYLFMIQTVEEPPPGLLSTVIVNADSAGEARIYVADYTMDRRWLYPSFSVLLHIGTPTPNLRPGIVMMKHQTDHIS